MDSSPTGHGSFRENRRRLAAALPAGSMAVIATGRFPQSCGADSAAPWPDFFYLTGQRSPQMALIIESNHDRAARMILFMAPRDPRSEVWDGPVGDARHVF